MKWLLNNIKIISFVWWLMQGVLLLLNEIRVWSEHNYLDRDFLIVSICLIVISFLLIVRNYKINIFCGIVLFLYSIFVLFAMGILFFMEAQRQYILFAICLCFIIPIINILLSIFLLSALRKEIKE